MQEDEGKYFRVYLESMLPYRTHVEYITKKATISIIDYRLLAKRKWNCNPWILRWNTTIMVRPIITYGPRA